MLMKTTEQGRGTQLSGRSVKVTNNLFLFGLSSAEADKKRNIELLKERGWLDIPLYYNNNRRGIVAVQKGEPGDRAFADAFKAWNQ
jgi:hypothetical protein